MSKSETISAIISLFSALILFGSLLLVAKSNNNVAKSMRLSNLQAMVGEMNEVRRLRATMPEVEKSLFVDRRDFTDLEISQNLIAVQLANIFEWAFLARRDGLIEKDVWESWVETWRSVILSSQPLRDLFTPTVWTFGRMNDMTAILEQLVQGTGAIQDPYRR